MGKVLWYIVGDVLQQFGIKSIVGCLVKFEQCLFGVGVNVGCVVFVLGIGVDCVYGVYFFFVEQGVFWKRIVVGNDLCGKLLGDIFIYFQLFCIVGGFVEIGVGFDQGIVGFVVGVLYGVVWAIVGQAVLYVVFVVVLVGCFCCFQISRFVKVGGGQGEGCWDNFFVCGVVYNDFFGRVVYEVFKLFVVVLNFYQGIGYVLCVGNLVGFWGNFQVVYQYQLFKDVVEFIIVFVDQVLVFGVWFVNVVFVLLIIMFFGVLEKFGGSKFVWKELVELLEYLLLGGIMFFLQQGQGGNYIVCLVDLLVLQEYIVGAD